MSTDLHGAPATPRNAEHEHLYQLPAPYKLTGPYIDNLAPDVKLIRAVARRAGYPIGNVYPGLMMIVGNGGTAASPHEMFLVGFDCQSRFQFAASGLTYCSGLGMFVHYLRTNPTSFVVQ